MEAVAMNTNRDLNYRLYVQKLDGFTRTTFQNELRNYMVIRAGDVEQVHRNFAELRKDFWSGKGQLSDDPLRNAIYHFVTAIAVIGRLCVDGGLGHDEAYTLGDIYIRRADRCTSPDEIIDLFEEMAADYAARMRALRKNNVFSFHIRRCIDYIYEHLHEKLTVSELAEVTGLSPTYLSKLFLKETGATIKDFVLRAKIETTKNMLRYSDFTYLEIALALGFSSQSAFISVFRKYCGMTPKQYRDAEGQHGLITSDS